MAPPALTLASIAVYPRTPRDDTHFATGSARTSAFVLPGTPGAQLFPRTPGAQLFPRTPRTARPPAEYSPVGADQDEDVGGEEDDALLAAAAEEARLLPPGDLSWEEKRGMALLALLYAIQGVPLGLTVGSIPFLLRAHLSYAQLGTFALAAYPYSAKLAWSPLVDARFSARLGRRKSWVVPLQAAIGGLLLYLSMHIEACLTMPAEKLGMMTVTFSLLVLCAATQDVAIDGWALTLLSARNVSYASAAQLAGLNTGFYLSYPILMALSSPTFSEKWGVPMLSLTWYLRFWAAVCFAVAAGLLLFKTEAPVAPRDVRSVSAVYRTIWRVLCMPQVRTLTAIHLLAKLAFAAHDAASALKLLDAGLAREDLSLLAALDFPVQLVGGALAARWCTPRAPLRPWAAAFGPRAALVGAMAVLVAVFRPVGWCYALLGVLWFAQSFAGTLQYASMAAFHVRVADPAVGGSYMTLLATFANLGGTWPRWFVLRGVDAFSQARCEGEPAWAALGDAAECVSQAGKTACAAAEGTCVVARDGYYVVQGLCLVLGLAIVLGYVVPRARELQDLPVEKWRLPPKEG